MPELPEVDPVKNFRLVLRQLADSHSEIQRGKNIKIIMPELPEVEILRRGLEKYIKGMVVDSIEVRNHKVFEGKRSEVIGGKVVNIRRFGKMLSIDLSNGNSLAVHVKMTGRLIYRGKKLSKKLVIDKDLVELPNKHTHVVFSFTNRDKLYYNDVRKFGWIKVLKSKDITLMPFVAKLGPEPFRDLDAEKFREILSKYSRPIKTLIMDQSRVSGVGNIYANEALYLSKILPERKSNSISKNGSDKLFKNILLVLGDGIKHGGSSTDSFRDVLGRKGKYQERYFVYNRGNESCKKRGCLGKIKKINISGRGTYFCPKCQK